MTLGEQESAAAPPHGQARLAGFFYAIVVTTGIFSLAYAPTRVFAGGGAAAMAASASAEEFLLRQMIVGEAACYVAFAALGVALHRLLSGVEAFLAGLMAVLVLISVPFGFANIAHLLEILRAVEAAGPDAPQKIAAALDRYQAGIFLQSVPWGLWLIPFGVLVIRCGFLPWALGVLLILAGLGYVAHFSGRMLFDGYQASGLRDIFAAPRIGEMLICAWLLLFGARRSPFFWLKQV